MRKFIFNQVEQLECRVTPSRFRWHPVGADRNWNNTDNWDVQGTFGGWGAPSAPPGVNDDAEYWGTYNQNCVVTDDVIVKSLQVRGATGESGPDYTGLILIHKSVNLTGPVSIIGSPAMLVGAPSGAGTINIGGASS